MAAALALLPVCAMLPAHAQVAPKRASPPVVTPAPVAATVKADAMLRIACDGASSRAEVTVNGIFKGECPVDIPVAEGTLKVRAVKQVDTLRERIFELEFRMASGTVKRVDVELGPTQPNAKARQDEEDRVKQQQALAAQRAAEERQIALERERKEAEARAAQAQASALLKSRAEAGDLPSILALAEKYYKVKQADSLKQAGLWFRKAADAGSPQGMGGVGGVLYALQNPERDEAQAVQWLRKGADAGDGRGMTAMSFFHGNGAAGVTKDVKLAQELIFKAVEKSYAPAMTNLGTYYTTGGLGLARDEAEGLKWYHKAAEFGEGSAMVGIGYAYEKGTGGLPQNDNLALEWYRKAAELNTARAMNNIGFFTEAGRGGIRQDKAAATAWYRQAAELDDPLGQVNFANQYLRGVGVPLSETDALKWYRKAAANGNAQATARIADLEAKGVK